MDSAGPVDVAWLGRVEDVTNIPHLTLEPAEYIRALLWEASANVRGGITDPDRQAELDQLLMSWQQVLDNRPVAAFVWSDLEQILAEPGDGWEDALRDQLGLHQLDPAQRTPGPGIDIVVFRYPVQLVPQGQSVYPLLRRQTVFDDVLSKAFCTSPPLGIGHCVDLQSGERLHRSVIHPAVVFRAEHVWAAGTIRQRVGSSIADARGMHLYKLADLCDRDFQERFQSTDADLL
jgi:hypothetical protein